MPERYRRVVAAVVIGTALFGPPGIFWLATSLGHEERSQERADAGATYARYAEQQEYCARDGVLPGPQMTACIVERARAQTEYEQTQADLRAQQEVAVWTGGVFGLGVIGWLVSIVGIWFLYANLQMLQRQINREQLASDEQAVQFQRQLDKMEDANAITRKNGRAQIRAYPSFKALYLRVPKWGSGDDRIRIVASIQNSGQSPVVGVRAFGWVRLEMDGMTTDKKGDDIEWIRCGSREKPVVLPPIPANVGTHEIILEDRNPIIQLSAEQDKMVRHGRTLDVHINLTLEDVFGDVTLFSASGSISVVGGADFVGETIFRDATVNGEFRETEKS